MPSNRIDRPEHSFQSANLITEVITDTAPDDPYSVPLSPGGTLSLEEGIPTFFVSRGSPTRPYAKEHQVGHEDVFTRLQQARDHFPAAGLDQAILDEMIR